MHKHEEEKHVLHLRCMSGLVCHNSQNVSDLHQNELKALSQYGLRPILTVYCILYP